MVATHTFVITSNTAALNLATAIGTVDTIPSTGPIPFTIQFSYSEFLVVYAAGIPVVEAWASSLIIQAGLTPNPATPGAAVLPTPAPVPLTQLPTGTFTLNGFTYVISSVNAVGNIATITGTVNGTAVATQMPASRLIYLSVLGTAAQQDAVSRQMLSDAYAAGLAPTTVTQLPTGTFTL